MTKQNIYCEPQLFIGDTENFDFNKVNVSFSGNNALNSMSVTINNPDMDNFKLFNKPISFYLNYGSNDGVPIFRGFIKNVNTGVGSVTIKALDPRCFITGKEGIPINITETNNYDGFTVVQFLQAYIEDYVNINDTIISVRALKDIENPPLMKAVRGNITDVYGTIKSQIEKKINDTDLIDIKRHYIDMIDDGLYSNIIVYTEKDIDNSFPSLILKYKDGLLDYKYKKRAPTSSITVSGKGETMQGPVVGSFTYGNTPLGRVGKTLSGEFKSNAEAQQAGVIDILQNYDALDKFNISCDKGHYTGLGSIVQLQVDENELSKDFRLISKKIDYGNKGVTLSLGVAKINIKISDYI